MTRASGPHSDFDKEKAEGSRPTVDEALERSDRPEGEDTQATGITNRPLEEEQREQAELPPRGEPKKPSPGGPA